ncbi:MAG: EutN/CcmL family microcompartment protein [Pirellulales bacterium]
MQIAFVLGQATSTVKHESLRGQKLLLVQPLAADGRSPDGDPLLVVDTVGAGAGERVMITSDGKFTREWVRADKSPARWATIGICDERGGAGKR